MVGRAEKTRRQNTAVTTADPLLHLLHRATWGPRPDDVAHARSLGCEAWLDEQLRPEQIDDSHLETRLQKLPILNMDRHTLYGLQDFEYRCMQASIEGMITRAVYGRRQLLERVVEFWADHFNVSGDDEVTAENVRYQQEAIRPHALGKFRDLLYAVAKSPAMLIYLDNFVNVASAPNENYARELLELHTLGVDGGYTEQDVKEAARALTGWTVHPRTPTGFWFDAGEHDDGPKTVLGHKLPAGRGVEDGLHLLHIVASHPATARFVSRKLARRFVSDAPPESLVEGMAQVWRETDGDIRAILRYLFLSDEFRSSAGQKFRRPLDFFIGALRATGTEIRDKWVLEEMLTALGQIPYGWGTPDGYPDTAEAWMSTNGLLARWNVAMRLTHSAVEDAGDSGWGLVNTDLWAKIGRPQTAAQLVAAAAEQVFGAPLPPGDAAGFIHYVSDGAGGNTAVTPHLLSRKTASLFGLMLASPQYQWR
jgi:uncharacterized protein (DUF1800 family)